MRLGFLFVSALCASVWVFAGCSSENPLRSMQPPIVAATARYEPESLSFSQSIQEPALVSLNRSTNRLEFWPISPAGGNDPQPISARLPIPGEDAIAADGEIVAIAYANGVFEYNVATKASTSIPDPLGTPLDISIGRDKELYVANDAPTPNVAVYAPGATQPREVTCGSLTFIEGVNVDNEGDLLIDGFSTHVSGIYEILNSPTGLQTADCTRLPLKGDNGTISGVAVDPKTDDLLVLDNPDFCAGGLEGRLTIYPKPYDKATSRSVILGGNCTGGLILNKTSHVVFYGDTDVSGSYTFIRQATYPDGKRLGTYWRGVSGPITTIPNELPN
jgi:hypothetical protein